MFFMSVNGLKAKRTILFFLTCAVCVKFIFQFLHGGFYWHAPRVFCMLYLSLWLSLYYSGVHDTCNVQDTCRLASSGRPATLHELWLPCCPLVSYQQRSSPGSGTVCLTFQNWHPDTPFWSQAFCFQSLCSPASHRKIPFPFPLIILVISCVLTLCWSNDGVSCTWETGRSKMFNLNVVGVCVGQWL